MSQTVAISDEVYSRLQATARMRGVTIEQLLEQWLHDADNRQQRQTVVRQIDALRERIFTAYGEQTDSITLLREDRSR